MASFLILLASMQSVLVVVLLGTESRWQALVSERPRRAEENRKARLSI
jgi:hypothetical protein